MNTFHRANLLVNITSSDVWYQARLHRMTMMFESKGSMSPPDAAAAALASINGSLMAQAATMSYNDAFLLIGICFLFAFPAVLLLKRRKPAPSTPAPGPLRAVGQRPQT
jgi:DHA2 family multidrug resistance protein